MLSAIYEELYRLLLKPSSYFSLKKKSSKAVWDYFIQAWDFFSFVPNPNREAVMVGGIRKEGTSPSVHPWRVLAPPILLKVDLTLGRKRNALDKDNAPRLLLFLLATSPPPPTYQFVRPFLELTSPHFTTPVFKTDILNNRLSGSMKVVKKKYMFFFS